MVYFDSLIGFTLPIPVTVWGDALTVFCLQVIYHVALIGLGFCTWAHQQQRDNEGSRDGMVPAELWV